MKFPYGQNKIDIIYLNCLQKQTRIYRMTLARTKKESSQSRIYWGHWNWQANDNHWENRETRRGKNPKTNKIDAIRTVTLDECEIDWYQNGRQCDWTEKNVLSADVLMYSMSMIV